MRTVVAAILFLLTNAAVAQDVQLCRSAGEILDQKGGFRGARLRSAPSDLGRLKVEPQEQYKSNHRSGVQPLR